MNHQHSGLIEALTFDTFVSASGNRAALSASRNAVAMLGHACNPLFICGRSASGKTHLLHAIGNAVREVSPSVAVGYICAEDYCSSVATAYRKKTFENFRSRLRALDLLLLDDVQLLKDKSRSQEELASLIDALVRDKKQVVIASDVRPDALEGFSERLVTRLSSGAIVRIDPVRPIPLGCEDRAGEPVISTDDIARAVRQVEGVISGGERDPDRMPKLLEAIRRVWVQEGTDLRLGQLLMNLSAEHGVGNDLFYVEDDQLVEWLSDKERTLMTLRPAGRQVVLMLETSGIPVEENRIVEIAMLEVIEGRITRTYHACVDPCMEVSDGAAYYHGLTTDFVKGLPKFSDIAAEVIAFIGNAQLVVWNERFCIQALNQELEALGLPNLDDLAASVVQVNKEARRRWPSEENDMDLVSVRLGVPLVDEPHHGLVKAIQLFRNYQALLALPAIEG